MTHSTRKKIHVGSVIGNGRYEVIRSKVIYFFAKIHTFFANYLIVNFKSCNFAAILGKKTIV